LLIPSPVARCGRSSAMVIGADRADA
jgi:hypothetical protein